MVVKMKKSLTFVLLVCIMVSICTNALAIEIAYGFSSISVGSYRTIFSDETLSKSDFLVIKQSDSTNDGGARYVLQRTDTGIALDSDYLYGKDSTTFTVTSSINTRLRVYNDQSYKLTLSGTYQII